MNVSDIAAVGSAIASLVAIAAAGWVAASKRRVHGTGRQRFTGATLDAQGISFRLERLSTELDDARVQVKLLQDEIDANCALQSAETGARSSTAG